MSILSQVYQGRGDVFHAFLLPVSDNEARQTKVHNSRL